MCAHCEDRWVQMGVEFQVLVAPCPLVVLFRLAHYQSWAALEE